MYPCGGVAVFNLGLFLARYPEFSSVNSGKLQAYFSEAGIYLNNTPGSRVQDVQRRLMLLNMLVAHISFLAGDLNSPGVSLPSTTTLNVTSSAPGDFSVAHGLSTTPSSIEILATSDGTIRAQTPAFDATNVYLSASGADVTATVSVFLAGQVGPAGEARPVGRVSAAGEGSVNASFDFVAGTPGNGPWFNQTQYGAAFWQATTNIRSMHYIARPTRIDRGRRGIY